MKRVIAFGAFDPLSEGQIDYLRQAKALGDYLTVVVAHDSAIRAHKKRDPNLSEEERVAAVKALGIADAVVLGRKGANKYVMLKEIDFDIAALGYNQKPTDEVLRAELENIGKYNVEIVRCKKAASGSLFANNKRTAAALIFVAAFAVLALILALRSGGKPATSYDSGPVKQQFEVVSGWKTQQFGNVVIHAPMGIHMLRDGSDHILTQDLQGDVEAYTVGTTVVAILQDEENRTIAQNFIQSRETECDVTEIAGDRTLVLCAEDGGRYAYIPGNEVGVFIDASTLRDGTKRDLTDEELVRFVQLLEL